jgi:hypothetical protein
MGMGRSVVKIGGTGVRLGMGWMSGWDGEMETGRGRWRREGEDGDRKGRRKAGWFEYLRVFGTWGGDYGFVSALGSRCEGGWMF